MKILLVGYGKMGKAVEVAALKQGHSIVGKVTQENLADFPMLAKEAEVAIEFTSPESAVENVLKCLSWDLPTVCGSTGWLSKWDAVVGEVLRLNGAFFYASNYSLGVNLFFEIARQAANLLSKFGAYRVEIDEIHHLQKLDAPSGTAISLAEKVLHSYPNLEGWALAGQQESGSKLIINAIRKESVPGTHTVKFDSSVDQILLTHQALSREGFADGALLAAQWLIGKKGVFGMEDIIKF